MELDNDAMNNKTGRYTILDDAQYKNTQYRSSK